MKMRAPANAGPVVHGGVEIKPDHDGSIDVRPEVAETLRAHGYKYWDEPEVDFSGMTREEMLRHVASLSTPDLAHLLTSAARKTEEEARRAEDRERSNKQQEAQAAKASEDDMRKATVADVDKMNRDDLFTYLRLKGVSAPIPITNEKLKEIARRTASGASPDTLEKRP